MNPRAAATSAPGLPPSAPRDASTLLFGRPVRHARPVEPRRALAQAVALGGVLFALACSPAPLAAPQQRIAVTPWYTCAIEDDGAVVCWGDDESIALARFGFAAAT